jgi:hypothetical protein
MSRRNLTCDLILLVSLSSQAHASPPLQRTRSNVRSAHAGGLRPTAPLLRSHKDSRRGPCMRPIVNLEGRIAVPGALR